MSYVGDDRYCTGMAPAPTDAATARASPRRDGAGASSVPVPSRAVARRSARRARPADPAALSRGVLRARAAALHRAREPARRARGAASTCARSASSSTPAAASGSPATSARARRRSRCSSRRRRWRPTAPSRSTRSPPARPAARHLLRRRPYSLNDLIDRLSAVDLLHIDDVGAEHVRPGCSSSSTRSSTRATRSAARSC